MAYCSKRSCRISPWWRRRMALCSLSLQQCALCPVFFACEDCIKAVKAAQFAALPTSSPPRMLREEGVHVKATLLLLSLWFGVTAGALAGPYPHKPVTMVVVYAAGGPSDTVARTIAPAMQRHLGQSIIIETMAGAGGRIGSAYVARAKPDGYTILLHHISMALGPTLHAGLEYDPLQDFDAIGELTDVPMVLIGRPGLPAADLPALLRELQERRRSFAIGYAGTASASHLCTLLLAEATGARFVGVNYKGTAPAMQDLLDERIDLLCDQSTPATAHIRGGKVRAYGITTSERVASLKRVPTLREGGLPQVDISVWHALYVPKGTPAEVRNKLTEALRYALTDAAVRARLKDLGTEPVSLDQATPDYARAHLAAEIERWSAVIERSGRRLLDAPTVAP
jgi:tripartite-type tricarboxylate transporter receptor subunit TctC